MVILALLIAAFFIRMPQVSGLSMEPHIVSGEYVLINTIAYRLAPPHRGDIIAFRHDGDPPEIFIKRVIGLPGDRVRIERGTVFLNGVPLSEPYIRFTDTRSFPEVTVPPGAVFVLGDNRANSEDSRVFGPVRERLIIGRAIAGVWPIHDIGAL